MRHSETHSLLLIRMKLKYDEYKRKRWRLIQYVRTGLICKSLENTIHLISEIIISEITIKN